MGNECMTKVYKVIYTANNEEPDCGKCDNLTSASEEYCTECGKGMWCHYKRTEFEMRPIGKE